MTAPAEQTVPANEMGLQTPGVYRAYGSGAPNWIGLPIYVGFVVILLFAIAPQAIHPAPLRGAGGAVIWWLDKIAFSSGFVAAYAVWRWLTWRLRDRYKDKLLVSADDAGIRLPSGKCIPYEVIYQIDPHGSGSAMGADNWIAIQTYRRSRSWRVDVNMSVDPPEDILANLRERALAGGAKLRPARFNGRRPRGLTQLGYRDGMGWEG